MILIFSFEDCTNARMKRKSHSADPVLGLKVTLPPNKSSPDLHAQEDGLPAEGSGDSGGVSPATAPRLADDGAAQEASPASPPCSGAENGDGVLVPPEQEVPTSPVDGGIELKSPEKKGRKVSFQKPLGMVEYTVEEKDTLNSIALRFNTTPNELLHNNRLFSHTIVTGQCLYVPDPDGATSERGSPPMSPCSPSSLHPLQRGPPGAAGARDQPLASSSPRSHRVLRDQASLSEEEEPMTKKFLKISCKYITNGKGVVGGVLLVTPNSLMFDPHKSDPLVLEHGCRAYGLLCPMEEVISAAVYRDTAHMSIRDTLPANFSECFCSPSRPEDVGAFAPEHELSPFTRLERERARSALASEPSPEPVPGRPPDGSARPPAGPPDGRGCRSCGGLAADDGDGASDDAPAGGAAAASAADDGDDADDDETPSDRASWSLASAATQANGSSSACENGDADSGAGEKEEAPWAEDVPTGEEHGGARALLESTKIQGDGSPPLHERRETDGLTTSSVASDLSSVDATAKGNGGEPETTGPDLTMPNGETAEGESERPEVALDPVTGDGDVRGATITAEVPAAPSGEEDPAKGEESSGISVEEHPGRDSSDARAGDVATASASCAHEHGVAAAQNENELSAAMMNASTASVLTPANGGDKTDAETSAAEEAEPSAARTETRNEQSSGISMGSSTVGRSTVWYVEEEELEAVMADRTGDRDDKEDAAAAADVSSEGQDEHPGPDVARAPLVREAERSGRKWRSLADLPRRVVMKGPPKEGSGSAQNEAGGGGSQKGGGNARQKRGSGARQKRAGSGSSAFQKGCGGVPQRKGGSAKQEEGSGAKHEEGDAARRKGGGGATREETASLPQEEAAVAQHEVSDDVTEEGGGGLAQEEGVDVQQEGMGRDACEVDGATGTKLAGSAKGKKRKGDGGEGVSRPRWERTKIYSEAQKEPLHRLLKTMEEPIEALLPAREPESDSPPMFLCLRVGKPMRCSFEPARSPVVQHYACRGAQPEYWFAVPKDRVDQLYTFFAQWTPEVCGCGGGAGGGGGGGGGGSGDGSGELGFVVLERHDAEALEAIEDFYSDSSMDWEIVTLEEALRRQSLHTLTDSEPEPMWPTLNVESNLLQHHHIEKLVPELPPRTVGYTWSLLYGTAQHGTSLGTLYRSALLSDSPMLLVVCDTDGQIFGAFVSSAIRCNDHYYGTGETFLFTFNPDFKIFRWTGENSFFVSGDKDSLVIGGGDGVFGLWLGGDLYHGSSRRCHTFKNEPLGTRDDFCVRALEVWAFE
ncbi:oxidation resistance protein 1-like isoform X2 [Lethenteron reissneri]|uniref:oxidation resistance protein 1-like isoform X2 n=1 Tax=Lethenteron reissneri TaxID=7753 RepID=UPI002AB6C932|nr:oxidation resistance protein 1-like isoform X2 [Lethenteron reissneri]